LLKTALFLAGLGSILFLIFSFKIVSIPEEKTDAEVYQILHESLREVVFPSLCMKRIVVHVD